MATNQPIVKVTRFKESGKYYTSDEHTLEELDLLKPELWVDRNVMGQNATLYMPAVFDIIREKYQYWLKDDGYILVEQGDYGYPGLLTPASLYQSKTPVKV